MRNIKLILSYDGTDFFGWQRQKGFRTVQQVLEDAVAKLNRGTRVVCHASGRTDTGVHALGQVVHFHSHIKLTEPRLVRALNGLLPADVAVRSAHDVPEKFDASRSAQRKLYRYLIHDGPVHDVFLRKYSWHFPYRRLDDEAMRRASGPLLGKHDFRCFETQWPNRRTSVRTITHLSIVRAGELVWIDVEADGFLYNMVRSIAGTLVNVGRGYWPAQQVEEVLAAGDRTQAGPTAPPQGLFLVRVTY
jgi:tRNA pseudouridine38-40 synthase